MVLLFFSWLSMRCALFFPKDIWALFENIKKISFSIFFAIIDENRAKTLKKSAENVEEVNGTTIRVLYADETIISSGWKSLFFRLHIDLLKSLREKKDTENRLPKKLMKTLLYRAFTSTTIRTKICSLQTTMTNACLFSRRSVLFHFYSVYLSLSNDYQIPQSKFF